MDKIICPCCGCDEWEWDYVFDGEDEMPVRNCSRCNWPPPEIMSPEEWRKHPENPLNKKQDTNGD